MTNTIMVTEDSTLSEYRHFSSSLEENNKVEVFVVKSVAKMAGQEEKNSKTSGEARSRFARQKLENSKNDEKKYPRKKEEFPFWSERIQRAFEVGQKAHEGQTRKTSGEPYFNHCVAVAGIIESWVFVKESRFVEDLICAALLHDAVEDTGLTLGDIREMFGDEVAFLVDGVSKFKSEGLEGSDHETIKKVLEGYFVDPRVVILKLADRTHNMETLAEMPVEKQGPKAWETEEVYARLAEALGMWEVMRSLKDAAFPLRFPKRFEEVKDIMDRDLRRNENYIQGLQNMIQGFADGADIDCLIGHRLAGLRQIDQKRRKMNRLMSESGYEEVSDVMSIGITVDTLDDCYRMLGILRRKLGYRLDSSRAVDMIAYPADNGYKALKEVVDLGFGAVEIVIMTREMEEFNNWGVVSLIRNGVEDLSGFRMKIVFTPDGEIRVLPLAATGWDVATAINPELVKRMTAIIVDGKSYLPSSQIPHASVVQIIADRVGVYLKDRSWTATAMPKTRRILKDGVQRAEYENTVAKGVLMARKMLSKRGVLTFEDVRNEITPRLSELGCRTTGELLFAIGAGEIDEKRLDAVLDHGKIKVNKETLGLTTILVHGRNAKGVLHHLTGVISERGGDIVRSVNNYDGGIFEIRIVVREMGKQQEDELREELERDGRYTEVLVV